MKYFYLSFTLLLAACGHHKDVRPGESGLHRVSVANEDTEGGARDALMQANHYCEQYEKQAVIVSEAKKYVGSVDENTYKRTKMVTRATETVGGTAWTMGGKRERKAGGVAGVGAMGLDAALGKGYTVEMTFKCN